MHNDSGRFCPLRSTPQENGQELSIQSRGHLWSLDNWNSQWLQSQIKKAATGQICQIQAERTSHAHVPPHQSLWAPARHGGELRIPTGPGKVHGGAGGDRVKQWANVLSYPGGQRQNLQQQRWVGQSQTFMQVWWNLSKKTAWGESQRDGRVRGEGASGIDCAKIRSETHREQRQWQGLVPKDQAGWAISEEAGRTGDSWGASCCPSTKVWRLQSPHCTLIPRCLIEKEKKSERLRISVKEEGVHLKVTFLSWMGKIIRKWRPVLHLEETEVMVCDSW